jgi:anti-sigma B factor antagonist
MLNINTSKRGSTLTLYLEGQLDRNTAESAEKRIADEMKDMTKLILDLEKLEYISSAGLRVLVALRRQINDRQNSAIKNVQPSVMEVFDLTGLTKYLI